MRIVLFTHVTHRINNNKVYAYGPYVREMNLWVKASDQLIIVSPVTSQGDPKAIEASFDCINIRFFRIPEFSLVGTQNVFKTFFLWPWIVLQTFRGLCSKGLLHFRLPGNLGLIATVLQMFFPWRNKIFKYAGNWDPESQQPWSYRLQRRIVNNEYLTRNAKILVYGKKPLDAKHVVDFYTATYDVIDIKEVRSDDAYFNEPIRLLFVGSLIDGKRPMLAIDVLNTLIKGHMKCELLICGDGPLREVLVHYIQTNNLTSNVKLMGGLSRREIDELYRNSHFLLLPSKSEGWPKAVAEAMWWGCIPVTTAVSCVPKMLDNGKRGILAPSNPHIMADAMTAILNNPSMWQNMRMEAVAWSRQFTLERMRSDIEQLIDENRTGH